MMRNKQYKGGAMKIRYLLALSATLLMFTLFAFAAAQPTAAHAAAKATPTPKPKKTNCETPTTAQQAAVSKTGDVRISTVEYKTKGEYVEVKNYGTAKADIGGWTIRDKNEVAQ